MISTGSTPPDTNGRFKGGTLACRKPWVYVLVLNGPKMLALEVPPAVGIPGGLRVPFTELPSSGLCQLKARHGAELDVAPAVGHPFGVVGINTLPVWLPEMLMPLAKVSRTISKEA